MVLLDTDSKTSGQGVSNTETGPLPGVEDSIVSAIKQTDLSDLQNNINDVQYSVAKSPVKDIGPLTDTSKLSGTKRAAPEILENPSRHRSPSNNSTNSQLVYARRKPEVELGKSSPTDSTNIGADNLQKKQISQPPAPTQPVSHITEPKVSSFPAFAPIPMTSPVIPSAKLSVPHPVVKFGTRPVSAELNHLHLASASSASRNLEILRNFHWEARYNRLQTLLKKLDQRQQEDYVRLLQSLTAGELSGHAVELEKRSIQLSLEEANELQRVEALNMIGKSSKNVFSQASTHQGRQGK